MSTRCFYGVIKEHEGRLRAKYGLLTLQTLHSLYNLPLPYAWREPQLSSVSIINPNSG